MDKIWQVVKIINDYKIVINGGSNDLLKKGDELEIFIKGEELIDPITHENLGTLDEIKAYIVIDDLFEKMSICRNAKNKPSPLFFSPQLSNQTPDRLKVDPTQISGPTNKNDEIIRIEDLVRKAR